MAEPSIVNLGDEEFTVTRKKLREWLTLEDYLSDIAKAAEAQDIDEFLNLLCSYVSAAVGSSIDIDAVTAIDIISTFDTCIGVNKLKTKFPILSFPNKKSVGTPAWEYDGRAWYFWVNLLSSSYGWSIEYIAEMDVEDALGLYQEISLDEHLQREWDWSLSDIAYPYNAATKKSEFKEYPRPEWMREVRIFEPAKKVKVLKEHLPVGNVISFVKDDDKDTDTQGIL